LHLTADRPPGPVREVSGSAQHGGPGRHGRSTMIVAGHDPILGVVAVAGARLCVHGRDGGGGPGFQM